MHGIIYQISDSPIDRDDYIGVDTVSEGDMADFDYLYDTTEEERRKQIQYLVEHTLPKGMFTMTRTTRRLCIKAVSRSGESRISTLSEQGRKQSTRKTSWNG